jgi:hypothetical protein
MKNFTIFSIRKFKRVKRRPPAQTIKSKQLRQMVIGNRKFGVVLYVIADSTKHGPRSMDPLSGLGPWTPSMDRVIGPLYGPGPWAPPWAANFDITVKHDSSFQFLKIF